MGKVLWIGAIVLALWAGTEIMNNGVKGAFGGLFASAAPSEESDTRSIPKRAGDSALRAHQQADERRGRMLGE